jgi:hypothetical protein
MCYFLKSDPPLDFQLTENDEYDPGADHTNVTFVVLVSDSSKLDALVASKKKFTITGTFQDRDNRNQAGPTRFYPSDSDPLSK